MRLVMDPEPMRSWHMDASKTGQTGSHRVWDCAWVASSQLARWLELEEGDCRRACHRLDDFGEHEG